MVERMSDMEKEENEMEKTVRELERQEEKKVAEMMIMNSKNKQKKYQRMRYFVNTSNFEVKLQASWRHILNQ